MKESRLETKVGIFVLAGLLAMAGLTVAFGKLGNYFRKTYPVLVEFEDARDILKNSKVLLRGAQIGIVADTPIYRVGQNYVELTLRIDDGTQLPTHSKFRIDQYGMLGDRISYLHEGKIYFEGTPDQVDHCQDPLVRDFVRGHAEGIGITG